MLLAGFARVRVKGCFWIHFGGFEVVALLELASIAHVKVMRVNHVIQDYVNEMYIISYNDAMPGPLLLYSLRNP